MRHTIVEVRRNLPRRLAEADAGAARVAFAADIRAFSIIELDETTCETAAGIAEMTGARTLDALHLAAACALQSRCSRSTYTKRKPRGTSG